MGLFDVFKRKEEVVRVLEHPRDLLIGDMVDFALMDQVQLNNQSFQVTDIWTLDLGGDNHKWTYFQLNNVAQNIRLRVVSHDVVELGLQIYPDDLLEIFAETDIAHILDADSGVNHRLNLSIALADIATEQQGWVATTYRQEGFELAYRYDEDYRDKPLPDFVGGDELGCDFAWLISDDRAHGLEFRVFDGGRTEVYLCAYLPRRKIDALWPAKQG